MPNISHCYCEYFQVSKRDITLLDRSEKSVRATLWGDDVCDGIVFFAPP